MSDHKSRWIPAGDALIAMARSYADRMQVEWGEALARSQVTILRYLSAGHWPARATAYYCEKITVDAEGKRSGTKLERVWDPESQEMVLPREYWQLLHKSGADLNANWHLAEFDLPSHSDGEFSYSGFAWKVEFDREAVAQSYRKPAADNLKRTRKPGRRPLGAAEYLAELDRRIQADELESGIAAQSRVLHHWYHAKYPDRTAPAPGTIENEIRERYWQAKGPHEIE